MLFYCTDKSWSSFRAVGQPALWDLGLENRVLDLVSHSLSDHMGRYHWTTHVPPVESNVPAAHEEKFNENNPKLKKHPISLITANARNKNLSQTLVRSLLKPDSNDQT